MAFQSYASLYRTFQKIGGASSIVDLIKKAGLKNLPRSSSSPTRVFQQRSYFAPFKRDPASSLPQNTSLQASYLRNLNSQGAQGSENVISLFESQKVAFSQEALTEYIKALARLDRLDSSRVYQMLHRGVEQSYMTGRSLGAAATPFTGGATVGSTSSASSIFPWAQASGSSGGGGAASVLGGLSAADTAAAAVGNASLGSNKNPLVMTFAEPSLSNQIWRTVRTLGAAFILVTCVGTLMDEKSLNKSMLSSPDLKPQLTTNTRFEDVKGVDEAKGELVEVVEYLKSPGRFTALGGKLPKGLLLVGPPGTGKTLLAKAIAGEAGVPFFYTSGSEFEEMFVGVGARRVRDLFAAAKKAAPCIIFIDEIDAIGGNRNPKDQQYMRMTLNQLLVEMDGFKANEGVIVVAATNFAEVLDKALVRPGRFDRHVVVPYPDVRGRRQILELHMKDIPQGSDVDLGVVARATPGFSGAELANVVNLAALQAAKTGKTSVTMTDLDHARDRVIMGAERKSAVLSAASRRLTAYHEGGHALVALLTGAADPVHKATIVPRGSALGMVSQLPEEDVNNLSRKQMLARLDVCMGGRVAEEIIFGEDEVTTGASSDLQQATNLARAMVTKYGFSDLLGQVSLDLDDGGRISSETKSLVESEVKRLVQGAYARAKHLLTSQEAQLHKLAAALLEQETLSGEEIRKLLGLPMPATMGSGAPQIVGGASGNISNNISNVSSNSTKGAVAKGAAAVAAAAAPSGKTSAV